MRRSLCTYVALVLLVCRPAHAQGGNPVLVYCDDDDIGAGSGSCLALTSAIQNELDDFYLDVVYINELVDMPLGSEHVPMQVADRTQVEGALFAVWFTRSEFDPMSLINLHVYDPGIEQTITRTLPSFGTQGVLHSADVAFHARIIMGASLYSDLDEIVDDENLMALAIPEERAEIIEARVHVRRHWADLNVGYLFTGYPTKSNWYHGIALDAAFLPIPRLELFLDLGFLFLQDSVIATDPVYASLDNRQVLLGLGARFDALDHDRIAVLPGVGFHVGISLTEVTGEVVQRYSKAHPAIWAGLEVRVRIVNRVWLGTGLRFENLFRYERVFLGENEMIFSLSQFRFSAQAVVCVAI